MPTAPDEIIENFTVVETNDLTVINANGFMGAKPPENPPITDTVTPIKQPVQTGNG